MLRTDSKDAGSRKEQLKEIYKQRICLWCRNSVKECDSDCQCITCVFEDKYDSWKDKYPNIYYYWLKKNMQIYDKLFKQGLAREDQLAKRWKQHQLNVLEKTGTKIKEWTGTDLQTSINQYNETTLIPNLTGGFKITQPYYEYVQKKTKFNFRYHCQLCGEDITERYFIKHNGKKICIGIGVNCGLAFHYSDSIANDIRVDMNKMISKEFYRLRAFLKESIKKKLEGHPANEKWLLSTLERIKRYGKKDYPIRPEKLAELLLKLDKQGIKVFDA